jgi:hypothetical protein
MVDKQQKTANLRKVLEDSKSRKSMNRTHREAAISKEKSMVESKLLNATHELELERKIRKDLEKENKALKIKVKYLNLSLGDMLGSAQ